ncbi:MAG: hypothetical protein IKC43_04245 [Clostridia bacterium]|nr:hypothetical protein [Clostridia bacterium]
MTACFDDDPPIICTSISEEIFTSDSFAVYRTFPLHVTYLIKITAL